MANERRPQPIQVTPEQMAKMQEMDRQWRLEWMPPQVDVNGMERVCVLCHAVLSPVHNRNYDGSVGGFCNKLCAHDYGRKMQREGMTVVDAENEVEKYDDWKPTKHSPIE